MKQTQIQLTLNSTHYPCIFTVSTVLNSNTGMGAVSEACFTSGAGHIIIVDWTAACTKEGLSRCRCGSTVIELSAHHIGISNVPTVITHSAPFTIVVDLHTPFIVSSASNQSEITLCCMRETTAVRIQNVSLCMTSSDKLAS